MALAGWVGTQALEMPCTGPLRFLPEILFASSGSLTPWISIWIFGPCGGRGSPSQQCVRVHKGHWLLAALWVKGGFPRLPHLFQNIPLWLLAWHFCFLKLLCCLALCIRGYQEGLRGFAGHLSFIVMKCSLGILCHALFVVGGGSWSRDKHLPSWASLVSTKVVVLSYCPPSGSCRKFSLGFFEVLI